MNLVKWLLVVTFIAALALSAWFIARWWHVREWRALDQQQRATIKQLQRFPPNGWSQHGWDESVIIVNSVWGNVTFAPSYSGISNQQMRVLLKNLEQILAETNSENSPESIERIFALLLSHSPKTEFITGYRDELREYFAEERQRAEEGK